MDNNNFKNIKKGNHSNIISDKRFEKENVIRAELSELGIDMKDDPLYDETLDERDEKWMKRNLLKHKYKKYDEEDDSDEEEQIKFDFGNFTNNNEYSFNQSFFREKPSDSIKEDNNNKNKEKIKSESDENSEKNEMIKKNNINKESREQEKNKQKELRDQEQESDYKSDAILHCPFCFTVLSVDCQRHYRYYNQYRAMFVTNCRIQNKCVTDYIVNKHKFEDLSKNSSEPTFRSVICKICETEVAAYDEIGIYHFFNVFASDYTL
eukprot:TRINITY_DN3953_c0_g1_i1.p1 TRINITY_DN3953_c0_g1~~TRINITY_DN3953_c0_g1_i1.p1  ORF type:complete len:265 (+),score=67.10 TRINITY_DN3953_c0_g1_i1:97-891(+)